MTATIGFPKASAPIRPILSWRSCGRCSGNIRSVESVGYPRYVTSGRCAIALALQAVGIGKDADVLIPAYHCTSMVEPVAWLQAKPVFYRIMPNTNVDYEDIESKITTRTRALLVTHYFGFPQQSLGRLRSLCDKHRIVMIEDCAHAYFFGLLGERGIGSYGDFAIASSKKFFPIYDGGLLVSSRNDVSGIDVESAGIMFNLKACINIVEHSMEYGRLGILGSLLRWPLVLKDALWGFMKHKGDAVQVGASLAPAAVEGSHDFDPAWVNKRQTVISRRIMHCSDIDRLVERRRYNYQRIQKGLAGLVGGAPLFPELPHNVVPHVFPFRVEHPERVFLPMKMAGIPIIRFGEFLWEGVDEKICSTSAELSRCVLQFPCHQELTTGEVDWMVARICEIMCKHEV